MAPKTEPKTQTEEEQSPLEEMIQKGVHFGHKKSKWNPAMEPYIFGVRNGVHIIDLEKTYQKMEETTDYLREIASEGKEILFVATRLPFRKLVVKMGEDLGMPYVHTRWVGGTLTNFDVIQDRLEYYRDLEERKEKGELEKYPKVEQREFERELERLESKWGGVKNMTSLPDCVFVFDYADDQLAVKEARDEDIPVVAICNTDGNPEKVDQFVPANTDATGSMKYILKQAKKAVEAGKKEHESKEE